MLSLINKKWISTFFAATVAIFILSNYLIYQQMQKTNETDSWVHHTHLVIEEINETLIALLQITPSERAYFATKDTYYLKNFQKSLKDYSAHLTAITALTADNPTQQQKITTIQSLSKDYLANSSELIQFEQAQNSNKALLKSFMSTFSVPILSIQQILREMIDTEISLLKIRSDYAASNSLRRNQIILFIIAMSDILLLLSFISYEYQHRERNKAERERQNLENRLKGIIEGNNDMILALNCDFIVIVFNSTYKNFIFKLLGKQIQIGMNFKTFIADSPQQELIINNWERAFKGEEYTVIEPIGQNHFYEMTFNTIADIDHQQIGACAVLRDITKRRSDEINLKSANERLETGLLQLEKRYKEITLLNELSEALQSCLTAEEAYVPIKTYSKLILPYKNGALYLMHSSKNYLELATTWGDLKVTETFFPPQQCWALRRNQMHKVDKPQHSIICEHVYSLHTEIYPYVCVPLMAHNETLGLLYLEVPSEKHIQSGNLIIDEHERLLLVTTAEQISLAIANIKLRETLRFLSIRDPLTGLYNRRYLEETLQGEILRAVRNHSTFALIMIDIDHFKRFNDTNGHEAGDTILSHIGKLFQDRVRGSDMVCRFGGEEFIMVLYDSNTEAAKAFSERLRISVHHLSIKYGIGNIGAITISQGIAMFPKNGTSPKMLIEEADKALYKAKAAGRDRVFFAPDPE